MNSRKMLLAAMVLLGPQVGFAQATLELEQACRGDIMLTEDVVALASGAASTGYLTAEESQQVTTLLADEEIMGASLGDKLKYVLVACTEGRVFQVRNVDILNQTNN